MSAKTMAEKENKFILNVLVLTTGFDTKANVARLTTICVSN